MDELKLRFDDEAGVYLPKVVANENERKSNELERIANENQRKVNEKERIENEERRKTAVEQFEAMKDELIANVKKISYLKESKATYTTTTENENTFKLPSEYTITSMVWVYVNGMKLNVDEYTIDTENSMVVLTNTLDVIGTVVELLVFRLTTATEEDYETLKGYSPIRGVDYWTEEDITAIETSCKDYIDTQFSTVIDNINGEVV